MLAHLRELEAAGVSSIKIEGRNKKAFYVASVVSAYRRVLDGEPWENVAAELEDVSHRPYGTGFYFEEAAQATNYDGYEQQTMHVADVVSSGRATDGSVHLVTRCRNRYCEGDEVEILSPRKPVKSLFVRNLTWLPRPTEEDPHPRPTPVAVANRSCDLYQIDCDEPVEPGSFVRVRAFRRSARHEDPLAK